MEPASWLHFVQIIASHFIKDLFIEDLNSSLCNTNCSFSEWYRTDARDRNSAFTDACLLSLAYSPNNHTVLNLRRNLGTVNSNS